LVFTYSLCMSIDIKPRLNKFREDYKEQAGSEFQYFFCPVLFRDEDVELCAAHIINKDFPKTSRRWTVQRKEVDSFYGTYFESDFVDVNMYRGKGSAVNVLMGEDKDRIKRVKLEIRKNDKKVDYY